MLNLKDFIRHSIFWGILILYILLFDLGDGIWYTNVIATIINMLGYMFIYYIQALVIFPKFWKKAKVLFFLFCILVFIIHVLWFYLNNNILYIKLNNFKAETFETFDFLLERLIYFLIISLYASSFFLTKIRLMKEEAQSEREKTLLKQQLKFFQNQFNSHITFNFLSYCYERIYKISPATADGIELYSDMLRYSKMLSVDKKVLLSEEIVYIRNFIALKKILSTGISANFDINTHVNGMMIYPRILITFVENAFKHGVSDSEEHPITITLDTNETSVLFRVKNQINPYKKYESTGTGLKNARHTLDLHYKDKYKLTATEKDNEYLVDLTINLT